MPAAKRNPVRHGDPRRIAITLLITVMRRKVRIIARQGSEGQGKHSGDTLRCPRFTDFLHLLQHDPGAACCALTVRHAPDNQLLTTGILPTFAVGLMMAYCALTQPTTPLKSIFPHVFEALRPMTGATPVTGNRPMRRNCVPGP